MKTLKSVDMQSLAKFYAVLMAAMYGIVGIFMVITGLIGAVISDSWMFVGMGFAVLTGGVIGGLLVGYIAGAIGALIYNVIAGRVGGIKAELE